MAKGYWIARLDITDPDLFKEYVSKGKEIYNKYGGGYTVCSDHCKSPEGPRRAVNVIVEFKDYASALACYQSPEYQKVKAIRQASSVSDLVIIEGVDLP